METDKDFEKFLPSFPHDAEAAVAETEKHMDEEWEKIVGGFKALHGEDRMPAENIIKATEAGFRLGYMSGVNHETSRWSNVFKELLSAVKSAKKHEEA